MPIRDNNQSDSSHEDFSLSDFMSHSSSLTEGGQYFPGLDFLVSGYQEYSEYLSWRNNRDDADQDYLDDMQSGMDYTTWRLRRHRRGIPVADNLRDAPTEDNTEESQPEQQERESSPSRLYFESVGNAMADGFAEGINNMDDHGARLEVDEDGDLIVSYAEARDWFDRSSSDDAGTGRRLRWRDDGRWVVQEEPSDENPGLSHNHAQPDTGEIEMNDDDDEIPEWLDRAVDRMRFAIERRISEDAWWYPQGASHIFDRDPASAPDEDELIAAAQRFYVESANQAMSAAVVTHAIERMAQSIINGDLTAARAIDLLNNMQPPDFDLDADDDFQGTEPNRDESNVDFDRLILAIRDLSNNMPDPAQQEPCILDCQPPESKDYGLSVIFTSNDDGGQYRENEIDAYGHAFLPLD